MDTSTKAELKSVSKTLAVVGLGAAIVTAVHVASMPATKTGWLIWSYPADQLTNRVFEVVSKTNLSSPWSFRTNVVGTNRWQFVPDKAQEFFTIRRVTRRDNTNEFITLEQ